VTSRILVSLRVAATPEHAFEVFTREIGLWWRPNELFKFTPGSPGVLAFEPRLGGAFTETLPNDETFEIGRITAWEPGACLAFSWRQAAFPSGQLTHVKVIFELLNGETRVTVEHEGWDTIPPDHVARHGFPDAIFLRRHGEWWQSLLEHCKARIADRAAQRF
jgi:Activator of Hsp90 ATPase homolog 1-like protein